MTNGSGGSGAFVNLGTTYYLYKKTAVTAIDTDLVTDVAVVDFGNGFTTDIDLLRDNDDWADRVDLTIKGLLSSITGKTAGGTFYNTDDFSGNYGNVTLASGTVSYSAGTGKATFTRNSLARFENVETFYYGCDVTNLGATMYGEINIIPATSVYYEDSDGVGSGGFVTYDAGSVNATWSTVGTADAVNYAFENIETGSSYGYNSENDSNYIYSGGAAKKVTVTKAMSDSVNGNFATDGVAPYVMFNFKGMGFTVYSATGRTTGVLVVEITKKTGENTYTRVKNAIVNTYYGYAFDSSTGGYTATPASGEGNDLSLYQVPVLDYPSLGEYAEYRVKIRVIYNENYDKVQYNQGYFDFYFDGFKVYNPLGTSTGNVGAAAYAIAEAKYQEDRENAPRIVNLRDSLVADASSTGTVYVDGISSENTADRSIHSTAYAKGGAKKEVMLGNGDSVSFKLSSAAVPDKVALGAKIARGGTTGTLVIRNSSNEVVKTIDVSSGTDMYYDITDALSWSAGGSDGYITGTITIAGTTSDVIISLTNVKFSSGSGVASTAQVNFASPDAKEAWEARADIFGAEVITGDVDGDGKITSRDLALFKKYINGSAELNKYDLEAADVNGDGRVNSKDVKLFRASLAGVN
ncbi:MAG: dockerin type I repeat-containing protein [Clostridia bacterium]|nr:dockerin type I repeat-containing protein [Clostridia bacterium]